jgi:CxxC motif-containing protein (DUF1111 family)
MMGQPTPDPEEVAAVGAWLEGIPAPSPPEEPDADLAAEGAALFGALGCADCHPPPTFTNGETVDVGTGGAFQVPSLRGVSARLPIMHDGCADPLAERFTLPHCGGGAAHGSVVGAPDDADIVALVAYLEAL